MRLVAPRRSILTVSLVAAAFLVPGLPAAAQESLYVADQGAGEVIRYPLPSTTGTTFGSGTNPELYGLATGVAGQVYSVNNTGDMIRRIEANGTLATGFGTSGEVDIRALTTDVAYGPVGVAFSPAFGGQLIVSAYNSGNLLRLDATTGGWDTSFGVGGVLATSGGQPLGVAVTSSANFIYYTQTDNTVWRADGNGTNPTLLSLLGDQPTSTWSLALLNDTQLFVADEAMGEVLKYNLSGTTATLDGTYGTSGRVTVGDGVYGIAVSPSGIAYVTSPNAGAVTVISADGGSVQQFATGLGQPTGIALYGGAVVPEVDPSAMPAVAGILSAVAGILERRRRARRQGAGGVARSRSMSG